MSQGQPEVNTVFGGVILINKPVPMGKSSFLNQATFDQYSCRCNIVDIGKGLNAIDAALLPEKLHHGLADFSSVTVAPLCGAIDISKLQFAVLVDNTEASDQSGAVTQSNRKGIISTQAPSFFSVLKERNGVVQRLMCWPRHVARSLWFAGIGIKYFFRFFIP